MSESPILKKIPTMDKKELEVLCKNAKHGLMKLANNRVKDCVSPGGAMRAGQSF